ncbi:MAG: ABC transporter substrate-binding protein, partial [Myxococcaceae bacterium]|nr:ABC transporter substrate-binding protein [Myxococcaceae bacterium]
MRRRGVCVLVMAGLLVVGLAGCQKQRAPGEGPLRLGFFPNITHGQALVGHAEGHFVRALGEDGVEFKQFTAGPQAMEAVLAGSLDACYVGSGPALLAYVRSQGAVRVVAGSASGGAVLVTRGPMEAQALRGRKVAVPQIGNTQDIALRTWLHAQGLQSWDRGGDVHVLPLTNADTLQLFARGQLDAAWVPEPWGARLVHEAGGRIWVDERELWPGGVFPSTVLVVTEKALRERPAQVEALVRAHVA